MRDERSDPTRLHRPLRTVTTTLRSQTRTLVLYTLPSLDGVAEEPGDWMVDADAEVLDNLADVVSSQDSVLPGRAT